MRKIMYFLAGVILAVAMTSCEKEKVNPHGMTVGNDAVMKGQVVEISDEPMQNSDGSWWIPPADGKDRGGNRTCEDVVAAFDFFNPDDFSDCGEKVDIDDGFKGVVGEFPFHVEVHEDGTISFDAGDRNCLVRAVIVKGSNQANVYVYPDGVTDDDGLTAPAFEDGRIPWVSNITFCCACGDVPDDKKIAVKAFWYADGADCARGSYVLSAGTSYPYGPGWCDDLGFSAFVNTDGTPIDLGGIGEISIVDELVTITMDEGYNLFSASIYVGDGSDLSYGDCPGYTASPWDYMDDICSDTYMVDFGD